MARRAIWKGAISFGMVVIPVKLYPATDSKDISFVTLHSACKSRLKMQRYCPVDEKFVEPAEVARAYEYAKDEYLIIEDSDLEGLAVPSAKTIEISRFAQLSDIDPVYYERSYSLEPERVAVKPYYLLKKTLEQTKRVAIAKLCIRQKEHLCCLRPYEAGLMLETMYYPDEVRGNSELELPEDQAAITPQETRMAAMLVEQLSGPFSPADFQDEYRMALEKMIEVKLGTAEPVKAAPTPPKGKVGDLMEALKASIAAVQSQRQSAGAGAEEPAVEAPQKAAPRRRKAKVEA